MRLRLPLAVLVFASFAAGARAAPPQPPAHDAAPAAASTSPTPTRLSPADQKRVAAVRQYRHDLVSVVALRADPDYLLGAAILAEPFHDQTPGLDFDALSQRAAAVPGGSAVAAWLRLGVCQTKAGCPNAKAFAYLEKHAADNAAVWLIDLDLAAQKQDAKAERAALARAAAAEVYDDYYGKALADVAKAVAVLPPLAETMQGAHDGQPDNPEGVRAFVAIDAMQSHLRPDLGPLLELCGKDAVAKHDNARGACLKLARTLQWGSSPIARAAGLHIAAELDPDAKAGSDRASRNLVWQVRQYSNLMRRAFVDPTLAAQWLTAARNGGTELSLILATLRANRIPPEAPADVGASGGQ
jgi:hypothetical protein